MTRSAQPPATRSRTPRRLAAGLLLALAAAGVNATAAAQPDPDLQPTLDAHGGWDTWQRYATLRYQVVGFPLGAQAPLNFTQTADLRTRHHRVESSTYTAGIADGPAWITPNIEALGLPPAFFLHGNFYFHAMPFVFADPGVRVQTLPPGELFGQTYDRLGVGFDRGVGQTADDDYILYLDPASRRLHAIHFSVTHAAIRGDAPLPDAPRKVLVFEDWQQADGLMLPAKATFHAVNDGQVDPQGATYEIRDLQLTPQPTEPARFQPPADAVRE